MTIRKVLIFAPLVVIVLLLAVLFLGAHLRRADAGKSRSSERVHHRIDRGCQPPESSPIRRNRTAVVESMIFEGLIDRDEDLNFQVARVAESWEISEEAFFQVNEDFRFQEEARRDPMKLVTSAP